MNLYPVHWRSLEISYQSVRDDYGTGKPPQQLDLEERFRASAIHRWANGGHTLIGTRPQPCDHRWVCEVLQTELNAELLNNGFNPDVVVRVEDICVAIARPYAGTDGPRPFAEAADYDKDVHTHCKLVGEEWINTRSYRLSTGALNGGHRPWRTPRTDQDVFLCGTLSWSCQPTGKAAARETYPQQSS